MKPRLFIENLLLLEFSEIVKLSKLKQINRVLAKLDLVSGHKDIDAMGAAWALFAAAACPYARFGQITGWLEDRIKDEQVNSEADKPVLHLAFLLTDQASREHIKSVGFSRKGLINILFDDGTNLIYPKKTAKKITSKIHRFTIVPGAIFRSIAETAEIKQNVGA